MIYLGVIFLMFSQGFATFIFSFDTFCFCFFFIFFFINLFYSGTLREYNSYFLVLCKKTNLDFFAILRTLTWLLAISEFSEKRRFGASFFFFFYSVCLYFVFSFVFSFFYLIFNFYFIFLTFSALCKKMTFLALYKTPTLRTPTLTSPALCKNKLNFSGIPTLL